MRFRLAHMALGISTLIGAIGASPCVAQTRVTSIEELPRALAAGDFITIVPESGQPVTGRLTRLGTADVDVRLADKQIAETRGRRDVTIAFGAIRSLERRQDSARNGAAIGASIGAGFGGAMFAYAFAIDRNELDEWAPSYLGAGAVCTGIGALIGWAIDSANSKPHIRFDASSGGRATVSLQPVYLRGRGIGLAVSFSR